MYLVKSLVVKYKWWIALTWLSSVLGLWILAPFITPDIYYQCSATKYKYIEFDVGKHSNKNGELFVTFHEYSDTKISSVSQTWTERWASKYTPTHEATFTINPPVFHITEMSDGSQLNLKFYCTTCSDEQIQQLSQSCHVHSPELHVREGSSYYAMIIQFLAAILVVIAMV